MAKQTKPKKSSKPKIVRVRINPLFLLLTFFLTVFLITGIVNNSSSNRTEIAVSEFLTNLKENRYSRLSIQDTGVIEAQGKYIYAASLLPAECNLETAANADNESVQIAVVGQEPAGEVNITSNPRVENPACAEANEQIARTGVYKGTNTNLGLTEINLEDLLTRLTPVNALDQLRAALDPQAQGRIVELLVGSNFVIARSADSTKGDLLLRNITREQLETAFKDRNINPQRDGVITTVISSASEPVAYESLTARARNNQGSIVYEINGMAYVRISDNSIPTFFINWDGGISGFARTLQDEGIVLANQNVEIGSVIVSSIPWGDIISIITLIGFVALGYFIIRGMNSSGSGLMRFGQTKARMFFGAKQDITFKDVAGVDEAKQELEEIVEFLRFPGKFEKLGARIPKGVLMVGQPGTGKTLMARAIAGEAGVSFFHTSGSEFEEMLVGAGASRVRDLFEKAKKASPSLIFIDEIDAVARKRGTTIQSSTTEQTLNQILVEMDGFETGTNVIVIAATNRPDVLDPAILRPGRFDRRVTLDLPDINGRKQILEVHAKNKPLASNVSLERVAKRTIGFSGAELENTLNEAAIIAARENRNEITAHDIEEAATKVTMGPVRRSIRRSDEEINLVAVHEAGHAVVAQMTPKSDPVHRVSILSRGMAGGVTHFLPADEDRITSRSKLLARLVVALGGRAAEEIVLGDITTGASSDIEMSTNIAKAMVQKFGMSESLGLVKYGDSDANYYTEVKDYSDTTANAIDEEVKKILNEAYAKAKDIINQNREKFDIVVKELLEKEVLESDEFAKIFADKQAKETAETTNASAADVANA